MSKSALTFLLLTLCAASLLWTLPYQSDWLLTTLRAVLVVSGLGLIITLLLGKRVKFDPVLR